MSVNNSVEEISENGFEKKVEKGFAVIDFWASWCMPCLIMSPVIEEMAGKFPKIKFLKVNVDENSKLSEKFNIMSIPTLIIFKEGKETGRIIGSLQAEQLEEKLKSYL